jgi:4-amino-4-deoxy-L-arabinose transferase-like glycosyltransferase
MEGAFISQSWATVWRRAARMVPCSLSRSLTYRSALTVLVLVGFYLRLVMLDTFPFREDEAIYSYWALSLTQVDPLALHVWPDKPPIFLWMLGGAFSLLGVTEAAARWVNIVVSVLTVPVIAAITRRLWGCRAALLAALFFALNPFAINFAPTAYTDPLLVLFGTLALYAAITRRSLWAGLWLGAAVMTKQQGILYIPLVLAVVSSLQLVAGAKEAGEQQEARGRRQFSSRLVSLLHLATRILLGFALVTLPILFWDSLRWQVAPSPWDLSVRNYGGFSLASMENWRSRLAEWGPLLWYLVGSPMVWVLVGMVNGWWFAAGIKEARKGRGARDNPFYYAFCSLHFLLMLWSFAFVVFHVLTTTQIWDRYLLPLAPIVCLQSGAAGNWVIERLPRNRLRLASVVMVAGLLLPPAWTAAYGGHPIGGDHGAYTGLTEVVDWLESNAPVDSVLYHQVLGWHYRFYFFKATASDENRFDLRWYPHTVYLADNAARIPHRQRFLVVPNWLSRNGWERDFIVRQIEPIERLQSGHFTVYELLGPPQPYCNWCFCQNRTSWLIR